MQYALFRGSGGTAPDPLYGARGEALWRKMVFRTFQRAKMSPQDTQLNTISCIILQKNQIKYY